MAESVAERRGTAVRLARPRLIDRLDHESRLTAVTGPPGSGKSVLLDQWRPAGQVIRVAVDERHRDPVRLWRSVRSTIHSGLSTRDPVCADPTAVADALEALAGPVTLVLDGLDRLGPGPAVDSVAALLGFGLPGVRLVVAARATTGLPVPRLRLAGELVEIGPVDLAFTASEARELCARYGHPLSAADAEALADRTEGWAAAVALAAQDPGEPG
jgi:LuxR family maltose regulon positive regulatory protein